MNDNWVMLCLGIVLIAAGFLAETVSGAMPGAKPLYPVPLRMRVILVGFGMVMLATGAIRVLQK